MNDLADTRKPIGLLNYQGRVSIDPLKACGPNYMGEQMWALPDHTSYDEPTDRTRIGFSLIPPPELRLAAIAREANAAVFRQPAPAGAWRDRLKAARSLTPSQYLAVTR